MGTKKIKRYTLLDNFDKLDLAPWLRLRAQKLAAGSAELPTLKGHQAPYRRHRFGHEQYQGVTQLAGTPGTPFLPDLFRFLTGRSFKLVPPKKGLDRIETQWRLAAPPSEDLFKNVDTWVEGFDITKDEVPAGIQGPPGLFNHGGIDESLNLNFAALGLKFRFSDYFQLDPDIADAGRPHPKPLLDLVSKGNTVPLSFEEVMKQFDKRKKAVSKFLMETLNEPNADILVSALQKYQWMFDPQYPKSTISPILPLTSISLLHNQHQNPAHNTAEFQSQFEQELFFGGLLDDWPGLATQKAQYTDLGISAATFIFRLLDHLMFPKIVQPAIDGATPASISSEWPYHTYFVADFDAAPSEDEEGFFGYGLGQHDRNYPVKVKPFYRFFVEDFERQPSNVVSEWQLPNPYVYSAFKNGAFDYQYFRRLIQLGTSAPKMGQTKLTIGQYSSILKNSTARIAPPGQGRPGYPQIIGAITNAANASTMPKDVIPQRFNTVVITDKTLLNSTKALKKAFPYGVEIDLGIPQNGSSEFFKFLNNAQPDNSFIDIFSTVLANNTSYFGPGSVSNPNFMHRFMMYKEFVTFDSPRAGTSLADMSTTMENNLNLVELQMFDLSLFLNMSKDKFVAQYGPYINDHKNVKLSRHVNTIDSVGKSAWEDKSTFYSMISEVKSTIMEYLHNKSLSFEDVYKGKKCHTEILAYEIVKSRRVFDSKAASPSNPSGETKYRMQSIFLPNIFGDDAPLSYLDTQVFYDADYVYEVYAHTLVVGSAYHFKSIENANPTIGASLALKGDPAMGWFDSGIGYESSVAFHAPDAKWTGSPSLQQPYAVVVRAPYHNNEELLANTKEKVKATRVIDKPPLPPDLTFQPYLGSSDTVLLLLNLNYGEKYLIPNAQIFPEDAEKINTYKNSQKDDPKPALAGWDSGYGTHILYKTDDNRGTYEIYRLSKKPQEWSDFNDERALKRIYLDSLEQSGINDSLVPNKEYYYFARFVDVHGQISNPTGIFKVRIVKEEGSPAWLDLKPFQFEKPKLITSIPFKKYVKIGLNDNIRQVKGTDAEHANVSHVSPPPLSHLKEYKFRIISKSTGKKMDINVKMETEVIDKFIGSIPSIAAELLTTGMDPTASAAKKDGNELLNNANIINGSDDLC